MTLKNKDVLCGQFLTSNMSNPMKQKTEELFVLEEGRLFMKDVLILDERMP